MRVLRCAITVCGVHAVYVVMVLYVLAYWHFAYNQRHSIAYRIAVLMPLTLTATPLTMLCPCCGRLVHTMVCV